MENVINGKVEKIEIQEKMSPKKSNNLVKERSPVRITKEHVARGSLVSLHSLKPIGCWERHLNDL